MLATAIFAIVLGCAVLVFGIRTSSAPQTITTYVLQVLLGLSLFEIFGLQGDSNEYFNAGAQLAMRIQSHQELVVQLSPGKESIAWIVALILLIPGSTPLTVIVLFAALVSIIPGLYALSLNNFGFGAAAPIAAWIVALSPSLLIWCPWIRREGVSFLLITLAIYCASLIEIGKLQKALIFGVIVAILLWFTRSQILFSLALGVIAATTFQIVARCRERSFGPLKLLLVLGFCAAALLPITLNDHSRPTADVSNSAVRMAGIQQNASPTQSLSALSNEPADGTFKENSGALSSAQKLINSLWGPMPWKWSSKPMMSIGILAWMNLGLMLCNGLAFIILPNIRRMLTIMFAMMLPMLVGNWVTFANYGIVERVRAHYALFLIPGLAVVALATVQRLRTPRK